MSALWSGPGMGDSATRGGPATDPLDPDYVEKSMPGQRANAYQSVIAEARASLDSAENAWFRRYEREDAEGDVLMALENSAHTLAEAVGLKVTRIPYNEDSSA